MPTDKEITDDTKCQMIGCQMILVVIAIIAFAICAIMLKQDRMFYVVALVASCIYASILNAGMDKRKKEMDDTKNKTDGK